MPCQTTYTLQWSAFDITILHAKVQCHTHRQRVYVYVCVCLGGIPLLKTKKDYLNNGLRCIMSI